MKSEQVDLIRSLWVPLSFVEEEKSSRSFKLWISEGTYSFNNSPNSVLLFCPDAQQAKEFLSVDAFRFASHSVQTVYEMEKTTAYEKFTSWRAIQSYYAAYYAAHAVLRFFGRSFSHLESGHVDYLRNRCWTEAGYMPSLVSSYYLVTFDNDKRTLAFEKYAESHKDLWKCFRKLVEDLSLQALTVRASEERRQELSAYFSDVSSAITNNGQYSSGSWLSALRNEVNYKSLEGLWFPFSKSTPSFADLVAQVRDWRGGCVELKNPNSAKTEIERFFLSAFSVVDLAISIALDYACLARPKSRRSIGFSKLLNLTAAA